MTNRDDDAIVEEATISTTETSPLLLCQSNAIKKTDADQQAGGHYLTRRSHEDNNKNAIEATTITVVATTSSFWENPWILSVGITLFILVPTLVCGMNFLTRLAWRAYPATIYSVHLASALISASIHTSTSTTSNTKASRPRWRFWSSSFFCALDIYLCGFYYPTYTLRPYEYSFVDIDGMVLEEWKSFHIQVSVVKTGMLLVVNLRMVLAFAVWSYIISTKWENYKRTRSLLKKARVPKFLQYTDSWIQEKILAKKERRNLKGRLHKLVLFLTLLSVGHLIICLQSAIQYLWPWQPPPSSYAGNCGCDDLDTTECSLPFPSFHHMRVDPSSKTGWRMNLQGNNLPPMKSHKSMDFSFLNNEGLDGFSTMAPILFYLEGMKESFEEAQAQAQAAEQQQQHNDSLKHNVSGYYYPTLPYHFKDSITERSITLLWDVDKSELIPHTSRVDYLDAKDPIILLIPSKPLNHATHYGVAVVNAVDASGKLLPPTVGMQRLFAGDDYTALSSSCSGGDIHRQQRYQQVLLPSLAKAAPWTATSFPENEPPFPSSSSLQLMFDFVTMSNDTLKPIRIVRDGTPTEISQWNYGNNQVEITKIYNSNCKHSNKTLIARAIHGSISVPWWLSGETRDSILDVAALNRGQSNGIGKAKFSVYVPCSLYAAAVNDTTRIQRPLRAIVEYGHGVFYNRGEAAEYSLARVAEDQGYLIIAMDWRGMSSFDMPVVIRSLIAGPNLIQATRDNVIQGYANKIVLQHFARNGLLQQEWLRFSSDDKQQKHSIPIYKDDDHSKKKKSPTSIYYGNSQGGILGAAYTTLIGPTGWIDRGILGTPGTSYSLIMYKSKSFALYDSLLMENFYNNRHIRIVLSVLQLAWDAIEPSGILAPLLKETQYPPILIQSGLGDPVIPTIATEALARAYNASILPSNPRTTIFGISTAATISNDTTDEKYYYRSHVTWTELLYEHEYDRTAAPTKNDIIHDKNVKSNDIHRCLRQDCALINQMVEFINTGRIIDPCLEDEDRCLRKTLPCYVKGRRNNTKLSNWTCNYDQCS